MKEDTRGALAILASYVFWGVMPVYWKALASINAMEILAHRAVWSCVFSFFLITVIRKGSEIVALFRRNRRALSMLVLSGAMVTANWGLYIWAVNDGRILESSLGYFINPLVSILFGVVVFRERLGKIQWLAMGVAAAGVCCEVGALGHLPFVSLGLAFTFGAYGLLKKLSAVESLLGFTVETLFMTPFFLSWLIWRQYSGLAHFPYEARVGLLLAGTGVVTAVPLILFAWGVKRSAMTTVGIVQYASPILMFLSATLGYHEPIPPARMLSFSLTWVSIAIFTADSFRRAKKST
jgi:chloramphenicol-sensitive protein RarD